MSKEKRRVPKLRFPGFTEDWEQRKVNDIFKITRGQVLATLLTTPKKTSQNIYPVYSSQTKNNGLMGYYSEYLFENAITWTTDGANAGTVNFRPGRFYSTNVNGVLINENGYACYAVSEIINKVAYKYVSKVGNPKLMNNVMSEINIMITPDIDELEQISKLIEAYNQYITLHQRKLEHLNLKKKALLQKLFPKNGERYPELRFPGFTDAWEQRKLEDLVDVLDGDRGKNYPKEVDFDVQGHTLFLNASNVTNEGFSFKTNQYITEEKSNSMGNGRLVEDDVIITSRGSLGHIAWYNQMTQCVMPHVRINSGMLILRKRVDISMSYLQQFLRSYKGQSQISFISFGSAQPQLTKKDVQKINITYPANLKEQIKIETYFSALDNLITLHQRKLEHLQLQKKALLQQMFV